MELKWQGRVVGEFLGYAPGRLYELSSGDVWRQEGYTDEPCWRENPRAWLYWNQPLGSWHLDVEGPARPSWCRAASGSGARGRFELAHGGPPGHIGRMKPDTVTASEIADFAYCPEAWRRAALGHESANRLAREAGTEHHAKKARAERTAGGAIAFGFGLVIMAALALAILWWLRR